MLKKAYVEITNICNLSCSFCHGTKRVPGFMSTEQFRVAADKLRGYTEFIYFHLMGEPLLHPDLCKLLSIAEELGFRVIITTNGTLLDRQAETLKGAGALHRVNISLQSFEGCGGKDPESYIASCARFSKEAAAKGILCSLRLWNGGGENALNGRIISLLESHFPGPWAVTPRNTVLAERVFLEQGERFEWPDLDSDSADVSFCYALRDQIGILTDGTVVPCCLDSDGDIALGNIFEESLDHILASQRAKELYDGFSRRRATQELCRHCGYASRFKK